VSLVVIDGPRPAEVLGHGSPAHFLELLETEMAFCLEMKKDGKRDKNIEIWVLVMENHHF
jgi:hypothetical protein